jgi:hypothetical protein
MMNQNDIEAQIGEAWRAHYQGQDQVAIEKFLQLVAAAPDNIDAYWGLGLSYRDAGDTASAIQSFQKVKELVTSRLKTDSGQQERFVMLNRMVDQQLERIGQFSASSSYLTDQPE